MYIKKLDTAGSLLKPPRSQKLKSGLVILAPGADVGEHVTSAREELITVLDGTAEITVANEAPQTVPANHVAFIPAEQKHNVKNIGTDSLRYIYTVTLFTPETHSHQH
jgi:quercetin dioxygenase-like cupin family protein